MFAKIFRSFFFRQALVTLADYLAKAWTKNKAAVASFLTELDDKFEEKTGLDIPDTLQNLYGRIVTAMVGRVDSKAKTKEFWRRVLDAVRDLDDAAKRVKLHEEIDGLNLAEVVTSEMSPELALSYNDVKHMLAKRLVKAELSKEYAVNLEDCPVDEAMIDANIKAAAAGIVLKDEEPITEEQKKQLILDSIERQAKLRLP